MQRYLKNTIHPFLSTLESKQQLRAFSRHDPVAIKLNLASNDYLCLAKDPRLQEAARSAIQTFGTSSSGSPAVAAYLSIHEELECLLCSWLNFPSTLLWNSGYQANYALLKYLPESNDIILADEYMHHSALMGALEGNGQLHRYRHNNYQHLEVLLQKYNHPDVTIFLVNEALYSMDGDSVDFEKIKGLKSKYNFIWILDEAHSIGWYGEGGRGLAYGNDVLKYVDIMMFTFGKSIASQGAATLFRFAEFKNYMINRVREIWYTTYLSPIQTSIAIAAIEIIRDVFCGERPLWQQRAIELHERLKPYLLDIKEPSSPIFPILLKDELLALTIQENLLRQSVAIAAIRPPTVKVGTSRLRISFNRLLDPHYIADVVLDALPLCTQVN